MTLLDYDLTLISLAMTILTFVWHSKVVAPNARYDCMFMQVIGFLPVIMMPVVLVAAAVLDLAGCNAHEYGSCSVTL